MQKAIFEVLIRLSMSGLSEIEAYMLLGDFIAEYEAAKKNSHDFVQ